MASLHRGLTLAIVAGSVFLAGMPSVWAQQATPAADPKMGASRANPVPLGEAVQAGPLTLQVQEVLTGPDAVATIMAASPNNSEPREGSTYVAVRLQASNTGAAPLWVSNDDFGLTGNYGLVRRFLGVQPPEPALNQELAPGEAATGWVALSAQGDEASLLLLFDSVALQGTWADRVLALQDGAAIPDLAQPVSAANQAGIDPAAPLALGESAITAQWSVQLLNVVTGLDAFGLVDYRSGALGEADAAGEDLTVWVALQFRIENVAAGGDAAAFPVNAFVLVDESGTPIPNMLTLTPPWPDAAGEYYPGAIREGWVMFDVPLEYSAATVRFLPFAHTDAQLDPRYFTYD